MGTETHEASIGIDSIGGPSSVQKTHGLAGPASVHRNLPP